MTKNEKHLTLDEKRNLIMHSKEKKIGIKRDQQLTASVDFVNILMKAATMSGVDPEEIYKEVDFDLNILKDPKARISFEQGNYIFDKAIEKSPDQDIGLHMGERAAVFTGHITFSILYNSPTLKDALENLCRYNNLMYDAISPKFYLQKNSAVLGLRLNSPDFKYPRHITEGCLASYYSILSHLTDGQLALEEVHFIHSSPDSIKEHKRIFNTAILFEQKENKLIFSKKYLDFPIFISNPELLETLKRHAKELQKQIYRSDTFSARIESSIMDILSSGKSDINTIAKQFAMSTRSLQNKLKEEGTTYQVLLEKVRKKQAEYFLEKTDLSIAEVTFLLDYSEQSAFNRAFKNWTGSTPGEYRLKHSGNRG